MGTKYGRPFAGSRIFSGKKYTYLTNEDTKAEAIKRANRQRMVGGLARVTKEVSPLGSKMYVIWVTPAKFSLGRGK